MPDYKPNQIVRAFAVLALIAAFVLVVAVVATSGGGSGGGDHGNAHPTKISKVGRRALQIGVWVVHPGDTLGEISLKTAVPIATLQSLNPNVDPQTLLEGQRIRLRAEGNAGEQVRKKPRPLSPRGQAAVARGLWIVRSGDTLTTVSDETRIPIDTLTRLNPNLDLRMLTVGQLIALR